eukprot:TRINITY_DN24027_c0_g1_i2.p1 TRINITY_DN24027_c0_g1~~TRINITY_DN24027_c0_g1_i2.p1  ORF type:complete len:257 (-),score=56.63 TRINITY_DN24027_c0_g1_i2:163-933(-)
MVSFATTCVRPKFPEGSLTSALSIIGTTIVTYNLFLQAGLEAKRSRETREEYKVDEAAVRQQIRACRLDTGSSMLLGGLISIGILITAAYAFRRAAAVPSSIAEMAKTLEHHLGTAGVYIFYCGVLGAGLSSSITAPLAAQLTISDVFGWPETEAAARSPRSWIIWASVTFIGTGLTFMNALLKVKAAALIIFAQVFNAVLLPIVAALLVYLAAQERIMGQFRSNKCLTIAGTLSSSITLLLSVINLTKIIKQVVS